MTATPRRAALTAWRRMGGRWHPWMARTVERGFAPRRNGRTGRAVWAAPPGATAADYPRPRRSPNLAMLAAACAYGVRGILHLAPQQPEPAEPPQRGGPRAASWRPPPAARPAVIASGTCTLAARPGPARAAAAA